MNKAKASQLAKSEFWKSMSCRERATFQLHEPLLCMPFDVFHEAVEKALGRPVFTHEFARPQNLISELSGHRGAPAIDEIMAPIKDKALLILK